MQVSDVESGSVAAAAAAAAGNGEQFYKYVPLLHALAGHRRSAHMLGFQHRDGLLSVKTEFASTSAAVLQRCAHILFCMN